MPVASLLPDSSFAIACLAPSSHKAGSSLAPGRRCVCSALLAAPLGLVLAGCAPSVSGTARGLGEPVQKNHKARRWAEAPPGWEVLEVAQYRMEALVMAKERYRLDQFSEISPLDVALAWGQTATTEVQNKLKITQSGRWYRWYAEELPLSRSTLNAQMANVHLVAATPAVQAAMLSIVKRGVYLFEDSLIDAQHRETGRWYRTSKTRTDSGGGACEILLLKNLSRVGAV